MRILKLFRFFLIFLLKKFGMCVKLIKVTGEKSNVIQYIDKKITMYVSIEFI